MSDRNPEGDDLARTATAAPSVRPAPADALGASLGRYKLERELGEGGMGVVHAAFDPDLERRIALKVLRMATPAIEAKDRLLREARAMARLSHPNVVTVHEVGTANGRDYVAMELITGDTLADWLRSGKHRAADIVQAFLAAGRGLAAAHAAGIVHRDFKPHNVLRSRDGRIVVTDFGLAREAEGQVPAAGDPIALAARLSAFSSGTPSSLTGITATGSLLGTPAYMAPEQWSGGLVTPATDQFAYCVALWEALAGERPYRGPTLDELRKQAALGPASLDVRRIPRRLRAILRRGLDPDPARRWPNMDALLAQITRVERRPGIALAIGTGALLAASVFIVAMRAGDELAQRPRCGPPLLEATQAFGAAQRDRLARQPVAVRQLDAEVAAWGPARVTACKLEPITRAPRLACLDGVAARIDAVARAAEATSSAAQIDAGALLIDPAVCDLPRPPRLSTTTTPELQKVMSAWLARTASAVPVDPKVASELASKVAADPCASALAHVMAADSQKGAGERARHLDEAQQDAERCGDDRIIAESALAAANHMLDNEWMSAAVTAKLRLADAAVHRVSQRDLIAQIDQLRVEVAKRAEKLDEAIARASAAAEGFHGRNRLRKELEAGLTTLQLRQLRATPADLADVPKLLLAWRAHAVAELGEQDEIVRTVDARAAEWAFAQGDVAGAHARLDRLRRPLPNTPSVKLAGVVVDARGKPVADATITVGRELRGDSAGAGLALSDRDAMRITRSAADGSFAIDDAVDDAVVIAELGDRRSSPAAVSDHVRLQLAPTSRLEGRIDLAGHPASKVRVMIKDTAWPVMPRYSVIAPVAPDGSFTIDGIPRHEVRVFAIIDGLSDNVVGGTKVNVHAPVVRDVALSLAKSTRVVHVLVRNTVNTRLANAEVVVLEGRIPSMNALEMNRQFRGGSIRWARQIEGENAPRSVVNAAQPGDLFATMPEVPEGVASACALGLPELSDEALERKLTAHLDKIQVICMPIPDDVEVVSIEVPPLPRLE